MTMLWIYVDTNHHVGHPDHLKVFATPEDADEWFQQHDPEGVVFGYELIGDFVPEETGPLRPAGSADRHGVPKATEEAANDHHNFFLSSEIAAHNAEPLIGELVLTTDQGDIVLAINQEASEELIEQLTSFLDTE